MITHVLVVGYLASIVSSSATSSGCPAEMPATEDTRRQWFRKIYKKWPITISWPNGEPLRESEEWKEYHRKKENGLMTLKDPQERWEFWLEQVQIRALKNWTRTGWAMSKMPPKLHEKVVENFRKKFVPPEKAANHSIPLYTTGDQSLVTLDKKLNDDITRTVQKLVAKWAGLNADDIEPTITYGVRTYWKGSTLKTHVDRINTHILSAVYCVDASYPEGASRWPIETDPDLTGKHVRTDVKPGRLFFYESAKLSHGRPTKLEGDYSAHMFIHYRPKGWTVDNIDRIYGVPPGFDDSPTKPEDAVLKNEL